MGWSRVGQEDEYWVGQAGGHTFPLPTCELTNKMKTLSSASSGMRLVILCNRRCLAKIVSRSKIFFNNLVCKSFRHKNCLIWCREFT